MSIKIDHANVLEWAAAYDGPLFHALLCDPPYHLSSIVERYGKPNSAPNEYGTNGVFQRASRGFMGREWDGGDIAFRPETWAAFGRLLHPGAFGMAFASTRGFHRMAVAIEGITGMQIHRLQSVSDLLELAIETRDWQLVEQAKQLVDDYLDRTQAIAAAGFIIHPVIMAWTFGSGFPKATRLDVQIDRAAGAEPIVTGSKKHQPKFAAADFGYREKDNGFNSRERESFETTSGATPMARAWEGHRYGGQALKPALEPIIVFQKPYQGRPIDCITRTGAGAINIDAGRIGGDIVPITHRGGVGYHGGTLADEYQSGSELGRWPSNLLLAHSPECNGHCVELCPVRRLGEQSGESVSTTNKPGGLKFGRGVYASDSYTMNMTSNGGGHDDSGTAARYFYNADWMAERLEDADPVIYQAKASTAEREAGLEHCETLTIELEATHWESQGQKVQLLVDTARYQPRVIAVYGASNSSATEWSTMLFGNEHMAQSLQASKFIIGTKISSTMPSKILSYLTRSLISDSTADVNFEPMDGGNHAESATPSITSITFTNVQTVCIPGVDHVPPLTRWTISAKESFGVTVVDDGREKSIDNAYQRGETTRRQIHPTIKPIALARHLATLLLPPAEYGPRRLFVPFAGVASEMIGAMLAGWEDVQGVELEADHIPAAEARLAYWHARKGELSRPDAPIKVKAAAVNDDQLTLF